MEISVKWLFIQGVKKEFIVQHPLHFWPFLRAPAKKTDATFSNQFKRWLHNADSELYFFFQKKVRFGCFFTIFFPSCHSIHFEKLKKNSESILFYQLFKLFIDCAISFSSRTFKNGQNCSCFHKIKVSRFKFVQ